MRKIIAAVLSFSLVLSLLNIPIVSANTVTDWSSSEHAIDFVKSVEIYVKDDQENSSLLFDSAYPNIVHNDVPVQKDANIELRFNLALPDNHTVQENDVFFIPLPKEIEVTVGMKRSLTTAEGDEVLEAEIMADRSIKITFKKFVEGNSSIEGNLRLALGFDESEIGNQNPTEVKFTIPGNPVQNISIPINFEVDKASIQKNGSYDQSTKTITWNVIVNKEKAIAMNASIIDSIPTDLTLDEDSIRVTPSVTDAVYSYDKSTGVFVYNFPEQISDEYVLTYNTVINNDVLLDPANNGKGALPFTNSAQLLYDGSAPNLIAKATVTTEEVKLFSKIGTYYVNEKEILWKFDINESGGFIPAATLVDELPPFLNVTQSSIQFIVDGVAQTLSSDDIDVTLLPDDREKLTLVLGDISGVATVQFTTKIADKFYKQNKLTDSFDNTAYLYSTGFGSEPISGRDVVGNVKVAPISKSSTAYDRGTGRISWEIVANPNYLELTNMVITDAMSKGQTFIKESVTIHVYNKATNTTNIIKPYDAAGILDPASGFNYIATNLADDVENDSWTYSLAGKQANMYIVRFETQIDNTNIYQNNDKQTVFTNRAYLRADEITDIYQQANRTVNSEVLNKSVVSYDYQTRTFTWKVIVNDNANSLSNVQFIDVIPAGMEYVDHSFEVDQVAVHSAVLVDVNGQKQLEYQYPTLNTKSEIIYQTKLTDEHINATFTENKTYTYTNTAQLKHNGINDWVNSTATYGVNNVVVSKEGQYVNGNDYIDWVVHINSNGVNYDSFIDANGQLVIRDQLSETLRLDTMSVKFYQESLSPSGTYIKGDLVEDVYSADHIKYDASTRNFEFILPDNINKGYRLEFTTYVTAPGNISNSVEFSGVTISHSNQSAQIRTQWNTLDGSMSGTRGSITVEKVDAEQNNKKLEGASFSLIDPYGNVLETLTTDANGQLKFANLRFGIAYKVEEIVAPVGYVLDSTLSDEIILQSAADKRNYTFTKENVINKGTIQFSKKGYKNVALEDAEFTLYNASKQVVQTTESDAAGLVSFTNVPYGSYTIKETKAPQGYRLSSEVLTATIVNDGETVAPSATEFINEIEQGEITLTKVDAENTEVLEGAKFALYDKADTLLSTPISTETTDANGQLTFAGVPYGDYIVKELVPPVGYLLNETQYAAQIVSDGAVYDLGLIQNNINKGNITFTKTGYKQALLEDAEFTLYDAAGNAVQTATSDANGAVTFTQVRYGSYTIKETKAPRGYRLSSEVLTATIVNDGETVAPSATEFTNEIERGEITLTKVDAETNEVLEDATFALYDKADTLLSTPISTETTDANGQLIFTNVPYGDYIVKELVPPVGYLLNETLYAAQIVSDGAVNDLGLIQNNIKKGNITFTKTGYKQALLEDAEFTLYDAAGRAVQTATSDANGAVTFSQVRYGSYTIKETKAPSGYHLSSGTLTAVIEEDQVTVLANPTSFSNEIYRSDIKFTKTNRSGKALADAVFQLYEAADTEYLEAIATATSDANGIVLFENIAIGDYVIIESKAPAGYLVSKDTLAVTMTNDSEVYDLGTFENEAAPNILFYGQVVVKKVDESQNPLAGATFGIYELNGRLVETAKTTEAGLALFDHILFGQYYIKEIEAPTGYLLTDAKFSADVFNVEKAVEIVVENIKKKGTIEINKVSEEQKPLSQAIFALYDNNGIEVARQSTNHLGHISFANVPTGQYTIKELTAPPLYELDSTVYEAVLVEDGQIVTLQVVNYLIEGSANGLDDANDGSDPTSSDNVNVDNTTNQTGGTDASDQTAISNQGDTVKNTNSLPKTGDSISSTVLIFMISLFALISLVILRLRLRQSTT